ncbi:MAG: SLC13 family permease, partial [Hyphomicrobiaceae bacterium]
MSTIARAPQAALGRARQSIQRSGSMRGLAFFLWEKRWFFIALAVGAVVINMDTPSGLTRSGQIVLAMSIVSVILFVTEPVPLPTVALMIVAGQVLLLGLDSSVVAKSLMSDSVLFIMGSLMLAVAVVKQKLDKRIAYLIVQVTGTKTSNICIGISLVCGVLASVVGEHTVAAMMLPVAITLITLTSDDPREVRRLAAVLLFSISYGCSIAGIGTPSGGARNAIMIGYWKEFFFDPADPESRKYIMDYVRWVMYCYPVFLLQLPFVTAILFITFRPEYKKMSRAVVKLRQQIEAEGPMKATDWVTVVLFMIVLVGWVGYSDVLGLGIVAILGAIAFLVMGLVRWEEINTGVNWGVVLLYAAAISLGVQMKETGGA